MRLLVGDDWALGSSDIEVMDEAGRVLAGRRVPEGVAGIGQLHELVSRFLPGSDADDRGSGRDRHRPRPVGGGADRRGLHGVPGEPAAGVPVPQPAWRVGGSKRDAGDAHMLADAVRTDAHQLRRAAGDSPQAEAVKVLARTHKTLIWERTAVTQRLRAQLLEYFPAAVAAFEDLDAPDTLELLASAPDPGQELVKSSV